MSLNIIRFYFTVSLDSYVISLASFSYHTQLLHGRKIIFVTIKHAIIFRKCFILKMDNYKKFHIGPYGRTMGRTILAAIPMGSVIFHEIFGKSGCSPIWPLFDPYLHCQWTDFVHLQTRSRSVKQLSCWRKSDGRIACFVFIPWVCLKIVDFIDKSV